MTNETPAVSMTTAALVREHNAMLGLVEEGQRLRRENESLRAYITRLEGTLQDCAKQTAPVPAEAQGQEEAAEA